LTLALLFIDFSNGSLDWNLAIVVALQKVKKSLIQALQNDANQDEQPNFEGSNNIVVLKIENFAIESKFFRN
jgi:hypothetical protein